MKPNERHVYPLRFARISVKKKLQPSAETFDLSNPLLVNTDN